MRSTFRILFYINKNKVKADGTTAILCRISIDGKQSVITTGIYCSPDNWNARKSTIKIERENNKLTVYRNRIENTYNHILKEQGVISAELLKNIIIGVNSIPTTLLQAGEVERERLRLRSFEINSTTSYRQSGISQRNLKEFLCYWGMEDITFSDITEEFGQSFKLFLKTVGERRVKTSVEAFIPLHPIAEQILLLYNTEDDSKSVFPLPVRDKIWYEINQIGTLINLKENLSYHQSRHSFGTLLISVGVSRLVMQKGCKKRNS